MTENIFQILKNMHDENKPHDGKRGKIITEIDQRLEDKLEDVISDCAKDYFEEINEKGNTKYAHYLEGRIEVLHEIQGKPVDWEEMKHAAALLGADYCPKCNKKMEFKGRGPHGRYRPFYWY